MQNYVVLQVLNVHIVVPICFCSLYVWSLHIPDLTEQRREFVVVDSPGCEHLCVVVAESSQLCQTAQETSEVLRILWMVQEAHLPQHIQYCLLKSLNSQLVLHVGPVCTQRWRVMILQPLRTSRITERCWQWLTWCQDGYGGEESLFLMHHVEFPNAFVKVEHGCDEFLWNTCRKIKNFLVKKKILYRKIKSSTDVGRVVTWAI